MAKLYIGKTGHAKQIQIMNMILLSALKDFMRKAGLIIEALAMLERCQKLKPPYRNCLQTFLSHVHTLPKTQFLGSSLMSKPSQP